MAQNVRRGFNPRWRHESFFYNLEKSTEFRVIFAYGFSVKKIPHTVSLLCEILADIEGCV